MANAAGMLKESIWRDKDFRALPRTAQTTYAQLISQKELDRAGMQPLQVTKWAKGCDEVTDADIWADLKVLEERRFVFVDEDTDELFVRSYMRQCEVVRYPNILKNALRCAGLVASEKIRRELAAELRRLRKADAVRKADEIDPDPPNGSETQTNPSETVPEPLNPSGTVLEPQGYGPGSGTVTLGSSQVGVDDPHTPPSRFCENHPNGTRQNCGPCANARKVFEAWRDDQDAVAAEQAAQSGKASQYLAQLRAACPDCDEAGWAIGDDGQPVEPARRCTHPKLTEDTDDA